MPQFPYQSILHINNILLEEWRRLLQRDYALRVAGKPHYEFRDDKHADIWLQHGLHVQPYHYRTYRGQLFNRSDEIAWLWQLDGYRAFKWAKTGRDIDIVRDAIRTPALAYSWAETIGDHDVMRKYIDSYYATDWAVHFGDIDIMRNRIEFPGDALRWATLIGDREMMRKFIDDSMWACTWAEHMPEDAALMRDLVRDPFYMRLWLVKVDPNDEIMKQRLAEIAD